MDERTQTYTEDDFVVVVDKTTGQVQKDPIPQSWIGTDLAPNVKKATKAQAKDADPPTPPAPPAPPAAPAPPAPGATEPAGNASRDDWAAYARTQGATDADLVDGDGEPLGRDQLREKYGTGTNS